MNEIKNTCKFKFNDGKKCTMNIIMNEHFCRTHLSLKGKVDPNNYKWCDIHTSKPMIHDGDDKYYCKACVKTKIIQEKKIYCRGITKNGDKCEYSVEKEGDYCKLHVTYQKVQTLLDEGMKICNNWKRGSCLNEIYDEYQRCIDCRIKDRNKDTMRRNTHSEISKEYNNKNKKTKMCIKCLSIVEKLVNNYCQKCNDSRLKNEKKRIRDPILTRLYDSKAGAKNRNLEYKITDSYAKELFQANCYHCNIKDNTKLNGIDRIDSNKGYIEGNCVSSCFQCNSMKSNKSNDIFYKICEHIVTYNKLYDGQLYPMFFNKSTTSNYQRYKTTAEKRGINFYLSEIETNKILNKKCYYCGNFKDGCRGIDRFNSDLDYNLDNCVPCCYTCNFMKLNFSHEQFVEKCLSIVFKLNGVLYTPELIEGEEDKLRQSFENIKFIKETNNNQINYKFDKEYYESKIWNGNIKDLENIKIKLIIANSNDKLKDLWLYYRNTTSSLPFQRNSKLVGRQIYILVKDKNSNKYLGILSLSSDCKNMEARDNYIGWTFEDRVTNKKIDYIMNLSTCVPLQPFGFNFTGGKLLAKLAFSQEIKDFYKELYNDQLLGITTTGLYGKSIQYDRLKELKFLGYTKGNSVYKIPNEIIEDCKRFLMSKGKNYTKKFFVVGQTLHYLGLSREIYMSDTPKGVYFGFCHPKAQKFLMGKIKKIKEDYITKSADEIFNEWKNKWAIKRYNHLEKTNRIKSDSNSCLPNEINNEKILIKVKENTEIINKEFQKKIEKTKNYHQKRYQKIKDEKELNKIIPDDKIVFQNNVSIYKEKDSYYLQYIKSTQEKTYRKKIKVKSSNIQTEVERLIDELNIIYPDYNAKVEKVINPHLFKLEIKEEIKEEINKEIPKPKLLENFIICQINNIDYIQYNFNSMNYRENDRVRINSYDIDKEVNEFIKRVNEKFNKKFEYIKNLNPQNWKTTNKILDKEPSEEKQKNISRQTKYLEKKKAELGEDAFKALKAKQARDRREKKKQEIDL